MNKLITIMLLISYSVTAQVKYIEKDTPAPYTGYLFSPDKELEAKNAMLDVEYYKALDASNKRLSGLYESEIKDINDELGNYKTANQELFKRNMEQSSKFVGPFLYFLIGAGVATAITYGVRK